jgi:hypothetical protein
MLNPPGLKPESVRRDRRSSGRGVREGGTVNLSSFSISRGLKEHLELLGGVEGVGQSPLLARGISGWSRRPVSPMRASLLTNDDYSGTKSDVSARSSIMDSDLGERVWEERLHYAAGEARLGPRGRPRESGGGRVKDSPPRKQLEERCMKPVCQKLRPLWYRGYL